MKFIERRYCVAEAAFYLRARLGPDFGNFYTLLADQRRGKQKPTPRLPHVPYHSLDKVPYYLASDLERYIEEARLDPTTCKVAKSGVSPVYVTVDLDALMTI